MRLIDADALMEHAMRDKLDSRELIAHMIDHAPTIEPKRGEWKVRGNPKRNLWECSLCRCTIYSESESDRNEFHKWCGRCGARMKGADDDRND